MKAAYVTPEIVPSKLPPSCPEIEQAVLGVILINGDVFNQVEDVLAPEMFYVEAHRVIYAGCRALWIEGSPIDTITVTQRMKRDGQLDAVGGLFYVSQLTNMVSAKRNVTYWARIIAQTFIARELIRIGAETTAAGYDATDPFDLLDQTSAKVTDLYAVAQPNNLKNLTEDISDLTDKEAPKYYTFGIKELDDKCVFEAGLPHVFAGRPGIGKSIFAVEVLWHLTLAGPVLLFSPEMTMRQVQARVLARETRVPYSVILRKKMDEQQLEAVTQATIRLHDRLQRFKIDPTSGITPSAMRVRTERAMKTEGIIAFGVDHLHKMTIGDRMVDRDETSRVSKCMEGITEIAKNTMLPALVMCQLNRQVESRPDKKPNMADLKQTGRIEEDAALVGLLFRAGYYAADPPLTDELEINIVKYRDGSTGICKASINPAWSLIGGSALPEFRPNVIPISRTESTRESDIAPF